MEQSASKMFAELDKINARLRANVSDLTVSFETADGEQCCYHMYTISNADILLAKLLIRKEAAKLGVKVLTTVVHPPTTK